MKVMTFSEFANRLGRVIRSESSTAVFTRTLFEAILSEDRLDVLNEYKISSYKAFYNGNSNITNIAKKINKYAQAENFAEFIDQYEDAIAQKICDAFVDVFPNITCFNASEVLGKLFESIIDEATASKAVVNKAAVNKAAMSETDVNETDVNKNHAPKSEEDEQKKQSIFYFEPESNKNNKVFTRFVRKSVDYYSAKKTLLYAEKPRPFYSLYVCNDVRYHRQRMSGVRDLIPEVTVTEATVEKLEHESKYIIIQGTGGIGKSMFLTHLFLSSAENYQQTERLPILVSLKDYKKETASIIDLIWATIKEYDAFVPQKYVIKLLEDKKAILLLDGLDEIQSSLRDSFYKDLEAFIKSYSGNTVFITSRPVYGFVSYAKFSLFDIEPLNKAQAISLIQKLDFWDEKGKRNFLSALETGLYNSHMQFASNPLLLTIMLMTYSTFGEVPAKARFFYSRAYETMARLHDATKGSYKRPMYTELSPEDFAKYFAQFCARTYTKEMLEFTDITFADDMNKVIKNVHGNNVQEIKAKDFLLDLTDNLCIMYSEGEKYYFIHRSFQEYFAAVYFASDFEDKLKGVGDYFERQEHRSYSDKTFDMLYDMIPEKVERFIFLPYLKQLLTECAKARCKAGCKAGYDNAEYWKFLEIQYPCIYYDMGIVGDDSFNEPKSFIYKFIINVNDLSMYGELDSLEWPEVYNVPTTNWVSAYSKFLEDEAFEEYPSPEMIEEEELENEEIVAEEILSYEYVSYFGVPDTIGQTFEIYINELQKRPNEHASLRRFMEADNFPLIQEFDRVKRYYKELNERTEKEKVSKSLFDD